MPTNLMLRDVVETDIPIFFAHQLDPQANHMAAFTAKDPSNREAFITHWNRIRTAATICIKTILCDGQVAGSVLSYEEDGRPEVSYWLGREYWGHGIATWALGEFLQTANLKRPIYARVAKDNLASRRVLEKCGFAVIAEEWGFANARGMEIEELLLELGPSAMDSRQGQLVQVAGQKVIVYCSIVCVMLQAWIARGEFDR